MSYLAADYPEIAELDINPLLVTPGGCWPWTRASSSTALRARPQPYAHLALRPYPEEYVRPARLPDGTELALRPIRPEDEPLWMDLLAGCSREIDLCPFPPFFPVAVPPGGDPLLLHRL